MKKHLPIYLYGAIIIFVGVFLQFSDNTTFKVIKLTLGIGLPVGAILAIFAAISRRRKQVQFAYHEMHALAMIVYGVSILVFCNSLENIISITTFLFVFYAFSEIIFSNWIFNLAQKVIFKIVAVRLFLGVVTGIGALVAMNYSEYTLEIFGVLFIMVGINIVLYVPVMKASRANDVS